MTGSAARVLPPPGLPGGPLKLKRPPPRPDAGIGPVVDEPPPLRRAAADRLLRRIREPSDGAIGERDFDPGRVLRQRHVRIITRRQPSGDLPRKWYLGPAKNRTAIPKSQ